MKYEICPLCGDVVPYEDGAKSGIFEIVWRGRHKVVYHTKCIQNERSVQNGHIKSKED